MAGGYLIVASRREHTAGRYPASGHYQVTKARCYVAMATCLETVTGWVFERRLGNVNNQGFGFFFSYTEYAGLEIPVFLCIAANAIWDQHFRFSRP